MLKWCTDTYTYCQPQRGQWAAGRESTHLGRVPSSSGASGLSPSHRHDAGWPQGFWSPQKNKCLLTFACSVSKTIWCCMNKKRQGRGVQSHPCWTLTFSSVQWALSSVLRRHLVAEKGMVPALFWTLDPGAGWACSLLHLVFSLTRPTC